MTTRVRFPEATAANHAMAVTRRDLSDLSTLAHRAIAERLRDLFARRFDGTLERGRSWGLTVSASSPADGYVVVSPGSALIAMADAEAEPLAPQPDQRTLSILDNADVDIDPTPGGPGLIPFAIEEHALVFRGRTTGFASAADLRFVDGGDLVTEDVVATPTPNKYILWVERSDTDDQRVWVAEQLTPNAAPANQALIRRPGAPADPLLGRIDRVTIKPVEVNADSDLQDAFEARNTYDRTLNPGDPGYKASEQVRPRIVSSYALIHRVGTAAATPTAPTFPDDEDLLATITVDAAAATIVAAKIRNDINDAVALQDHRFRNFARGTRDEHGKDVSGIDHFGFIRRRHFDDDDDELREFLIIWLQDLTLPSLERPLWNIRQTLADADGTNFSSLVLEDGTSPETFTIPAGTLTTATGYVRVRCGFEVGRSSSAAERQVAIECELGGTPMQDQRAFFKWGGNNSGHTCGVAEFYIPNVPGGGTLAGPGIISQIDNDSAVTVGVNISRPAGDAGEVDTAIYWFSVFVGGE